MGTGFLVTGTADLAHGLDRRLDHAHRVQFHDGAQRHHLGHRAQALQHVRSEIAGLERIEEDEAMEGARMEDGHGVAGQIARRQQALGMGRGGGHMGGKVVDHPAPAGARQSGQGLQIGQPGNRVFERVVAFAGMDEGLEDVGGGVIDGDGDAVDTVEIALHLVMKTGQTLAKPWWTGQYPWALAAVAGASTFPIFMGASPP